jgi:hypothetical protein
LIAARESFMATRESFMATRESFMATRESFIPVCESFIPVCESFIPVCESFIPARESFAGQVRPTEVRVGTLAFRIPKNAVPAQLVYNGQVQGYPKIRLDLP